MRKQHAPLPQALLAGLSEFVAENIGVYFSRDRHADLERGMRAAAGDMGHANVEACIRQLLTSPLTRERIDVLVDHLTVGETYFFRDRQSLVALESHILPPLVRLRAHSERRLRIWSAGCASGEEPYSIAITLARTIPDIASWNISILATDINPRSLRKAAAGVYSDWSFRDTPAQVKDAFFTRARAGRWEVAARIRSLVKFEYLNLARDCYPSVETGTNAMDIVFCRNVLMYFEPARAQKVLQQLSLSLLEGGWLFLNPVEIPRGALPQLEPVNFPDAIVHRKDSHRTDGQRLSEVRAGATSVDADGFALPADPCLDTTTPALMREPAAEDHASRVRQHPDEAPARTMYRNAAAWYGQGRYAEAARELLEILSQTPADAASMGLLARAYANQGRLADASQWCEKAIAADKLNAGWRYLLATILQEQGRNDEAASALRRALYLDHNNALAHYALGNLIRRQGKPKDAQPHFRNALAILSGYRQEQVLPESEGITAGRLAEIIRSTVSSEAGA